MTHRTHASQQDEGLRRARSGDDPIRAGLLWTADRLSARFPTDGLTPYALRAIVRHWAVLTHDWSPEADQLMADLIQAMPEARPWETRGEYAIRLRATARGGA